MDLRIHFDRPTTPLELQVENNSLCILSSLGAKLKKLRIENNGRWINIRVNSKTYRKPIHSSGSGPATYGADFDVETYAGLTIEDREPYLLNWLVNTFRTALEYFLLDGLDDQTSSDIEAFKNECSFRARFTGKWAQVDDKRARVVIYQSFDKADIHIESKKYRSRTSVLSPVLAQSSPSEFIFQIYMKKPEMDNDGKWQLSKWSRSTANMT